MDKKEIYFLSYYKNEILYKFVLNITKGSAMHIKINCRIFFILFSFIISASAESSYKAAIDSLKNQKLDQLTSWGISLGARDKEIKDLKNWLDNQSLLMSHEQKAKIEDSLRNRTASRQEFFKQFIAWVETTSSMEQGSEDLADKIDKQSLLLSNERKKILTDSLWKEITLFRDFLNRSAILTNGEQPVYKNAGRSALTKDSLELQKELMMQEIESLIDDYDE
jgi:hypothetical protein